MKALLTAASGIAAAALAAAAQAHVVVTPTTAVPGADQTLDFVVGHGCDGQPTTALRVELPASVKLLMPDSKPGWSFDTERLSGGGRALTWHGGEPLTKADGFKVRVKLPAAPGPLSFAAAQTCGAVTVRWDEPIAADGSKPKHPAPTVMLAAAGGGGGAPAPATGGGPLPQGVKRLSDGTLADAAGKPLYTWDIDTMVGMSHCETDCAAMWPPLPAPKNAKPMGDWSPISRPEGTAQWTYKTKPLYTYSQDKPGAPPAGEKVSNLWHLAH
jgi:predicted lipoprotein with Yx(FWY)xxD motif